MLGQLGQISVNLADNLMVGHLGTAALAAVSLSISIFVIFMILGIGLSFALPPLVSEADGAGETDKISPLVKHSLLVNIGYAMVCIVLLEGFLKVMYHIGQDPEVVNLAIPYLRISIWSILPIMLFQTFRTYSDGMSETMPATIAIISGNVINILLNYVLIFGKFGFEPMGLSGAALASFIARVVMLILMMAILFYWKDLWTAISKINFKQYKFSIFKKIFRLGIPSSLQMVFEVSAFSAASVIAGMVSKQAQAAHAIAINLASTTFLICTGLAMAATVRVGNSLGQKNQLGIRRAGLSAIYQVVLFMICTGLLFVAFRNFLPTLYIDEIDVISKASFLLIFAAIFQIPDGVQVTALGALRGFQDVKIPTAICFVSYWLFGIPVSYYTALHTSMGVNGVWLGLLVGLSISAVLLTWRFWKKSIVPDT